MTPVTRPDDEQRDDRNPGQRYQPILRGMILTVLWSNVMADCQWLQESPPLHEYHDTPCRNKPYEAFCYSTVKYENALVRCYDKDKRVFNYNIIINLENPDENAFFENVTFYTTLTIQDGYLVTVPKDVFNMTKLTDIKISRNKLRKVNFNDFSPLPNLKRIDLTNNTVIIIETAEADEEHISYSSVQDIDISFNFIEHVPNNFVKRFSELEHLNMSHNMISSIDKHAFEGTVQLKTLDLSYNRLQDLGNLFFQLPKLLDLNYATSKNLQKLSKLVLDFNYISDVNFKEFFDTGIPELSIGGNRISCQDLARVKYSKFSDKFNRIVTAQNFDFDSKNINGILCQDAAQNEIKDTNIVSDNLSSNSSVLISKLTNAIENNSKLMDTLFEITNHNQKSLEKFMESTNLTMANIINQLTEMKQKLLPPPFLIPIMSTDDPNHVSTDADYNN